VEVLGHIHQIYAYLLKQARHISGFLLIKIGMAPLLHRIHLKLMLSKTFPKKNQTN